MQYRADRDVLKVTWFHKMTKQVRSGYKSITLTPRPQGFLDICVNSDSDKQAVKHLSIFCAVSKCGVILLGDFDLCLEFLVFTKFKMNQRGLDGALPLLVQRRIFGT
jgi:hypothetical protein